MSSHELEGGFDRKSRRRRKPSSREYSVVRLTSWCSSYEYGTDPLVDSLESSALDESFLGLKSSFERVDGEEEKIYRKPRKSSSLHAPIHTRPAERSKGERWEGRGSQDGGSLDMSADVELREEEEEGRKEEV